jgi:hypothetical protein
MGIDVWVRRAPIFLRSPHKAAEYANLSPDDARQAKMARIAVLYDRIEDYPSAGEVQWWRQEIVLLTEELKAAAVDSDSTSNPSQP